MKGIIYSINFVTKPLDLFEQFSTWQVSTVIETQQNSVITNTYKEFMAIMSKRQLRISFTEIRIPDLLCSTCRVL